jgi:hypothetical protein
MVISLTLRLLRRRHYRPIRGPIRVGRHIRFARQTLDDWLAEQRKLQHVPSVKAPMRR